MRSFDRGFAGSKSVLEKKTGNCCLAPDVKLAFFIVERR
jgi:hypothetical protein